MADEAKKPEAKAYPGPQWGRAVKAFKCNVGSSFNLFGSQLQSATTEKKRDGVVAMELHPLGVLVRHSGGEKLVPVGGLAEIDLA